MRNGSKAFKRKENDMVKSEEIREKIETCFDPEEKEIALSLCAKIEQLKVLLKQAKGFLWTGYSNTSAKKVRDIIDQIEKALKEK